MQVIMGLMMNCSFLLHNMQPRMVGKMLWLNLITFMSSSALAYNMAELTHDWDYGKLGYFLKIVVDSYNY